MENSIQGCIDDNFLFNCSDLSIYTMYSCGIRWDIPLGKLSQMGNYYVVLAREYDYNQLESWKNY